MKEKIEILHPTTKQIEIQIQEQLLRILDNIPIVKDVNVCSSLKDQYDIEAIVRTDMGKALYFICEVKSSGEPKHIRHAIENLVKIQKDSREEVEYYGLVAAPYISPKSSAICEQHQIGYIDLSGNCLIINEWMYIRVEGRPNKYKDIRKNRSIFDRNAIKSSIILRNILSNPQKQWRVQDLSLASNTSLGQVSNVKRYLEEMELLLGGDGGFYVNKPKELIEEWARVYHHKPNTIVECYSIDPIPVIEKRLMDMREKKGIEYALTGFSGGVRYAPTVRYNKVHVYISLEDLYEAIDFLGLKKVESGANISIIIPNDPCMLMDRREIQGNIVASPVQVCLELLGLKGRGEEAAMAILEGETLK